MIPNLFVNAARANDSGNGTSWATAKKTIGAAVGIATTGQVIGVAPGTYSAESSGRIILDTPQNGFTLTIEKYNAVDNGGGTSGVADGACTVSSTNFNVLWFKTTVTSGTFVWDGINITSTDTTNQLVMLDNVNTTMSLTIKNCSLNGWTYLNGTLGVSRNLTFDTVAFTHASAWIGSNSVGNLIVRNCTGATGTSAPSSSVINLGTAVGASFKKAVFSGCTFTQAYYSNTYALICPTTPTAGVLDVHSCTISGKGTVIKILGTASGSPRLKCYGNTFTMTAGGVSNHDVRAVQVGDLDDTVTTTAEGPVIRGNLIVVNGTRTGHSNGLFIGKGVSGGVVLGNLIYGDGVDQGIMLLSQYCSVLHNAVAVLQGGDCIICEESLGNVIAFNSLYGGSAESTGFVLCFRDSAVSNLKQPLKNIAIDNVVHGGGDSTNAYGFSAHSGTMTVSGNILDWNILYLDGSGSGGLGVIDGSQSDSRAPLAFINWNTYLNGSQLNDENSQIADPKYKAPASGDLRPIVGSPVISTQQEGQLPTSWNTKGAWEKKPITPSADQGLGL